MDPDRENDAIADAVMAHFPRQARRLRELEERYLALPGRHRLPAALERLTGALDACRRSHHVMRIVEATKEHLDTLRDGLEQLGILHAELTAAAVAAVERAGALARVQVPQLREAGDLGEQQDSARALDEQLALERPWRDIDALEPSLASLEQGYRQTRQRYLDRQQQMAEEIRLGLKRREGFASLPRDAAERVLRPIREALYDTGPEDVQPTLLELRDSGEARLRSAESRAHELLDHALAEAGAPPVVLLALELSGREVATEEEVESLLQELRERLLHQLENHVRIRLV